MKFTNFICYNYCYVDRFPTIFPSLSPREEVKEREVLLQWGGGGENGASTRFWWQPQYSPRRCPPQCPSSVPAAVRKDVVRMLRKLATSPQSETQRSKIPLPPLQLSKSPVHGELFHRRIMLTSGQSTPPGGYQRIIFHCLTTSSLKRQCKNAMIQWVQAVPLSAR